MIKLNDALKNKLKEAHRVGVLGIGSEFRGDDAAGIMVAERLIKYYSRNKKIQEKIKVFIGSTAPENVTGEIKRFRPEHLIIIDSANMGKPVGAMEIIEPGDVEGFSFCTHSLPLKTMAIYLISEIGCKITIIGIQPKTIHFGSKVSDKVVSSVKKLANSIQASL